MGFKDAGKPHYLGHRERLSELLREVAGIGEAAITELKLVRAAALRPMRGEVLERPVLSSWAQVLDCCRASMGFANKEQFRML
jgi:DNA repair protein RadC